MDKHAVVEAIKELIGLGEVYTVNANDDDTVMDVVEVEIDPDGDIVLITRERV